MLAVSMSMTDQEKAELTEKVRIETLNSLGDVVRQEIMRMLKIAGVSLPEHLENPQNCSQSGGIGKSAGICIERDMTTPNTKEIKEQRKCRLACVHDELTLIVVEGTVNARVSVDKVLDRVAPLPIPTQYLERVEDAVRSYVAWPKDLIVFVEESHHLIGVSTHYNKRKQLSKCSGIKSPSKPISDDIILSIGPKCQILHGILESMSLEAKTFKIVLPSNVFNFKMEKSLIMPGKDIDTLFQMSFLNVSCMQVFILLLDELYMEKRNDGLSSIGFLCQKILSQIGDDQACNEEVMKRHWMLSIICPSIQEGFVRDPQVSKKCDLSFKYILQGAFRAFRAQGGSSLKSGLSIKWSNLICPPQSASTECGYYVMHYMWDIVREYIRYTKDVKKWFGMKVADSNDEMNEIRDVWAAYLMSNHF